MVKIQLTDDLIAHTLLPYQFSPSTAQCEAIKVYIMLLLRWNEKISLTKIVDPIEILRFHFGESLLAVPSVPILNGRLADVGTGAGFPGIALKLAVPDLSVFLIESSTKKAAFLAEVVRELKLAGVQVLRERIEAVSEDLRQLSFVTARALGNLGILRKWARSRMLPTGKLVLWLGGADSAKISVDSTWSWSDPIHIPGSARRFILYGSLID